MRILVTGSRDWQDRDLLYATLNEIVIHPNSIIIHGDCPTGADALATKWANLQPDVTLETYPANWEKYGRSAGPIRNKEMVSTRPSICVAFRQSPNSRGTNNCIELALRAGIPVKIIEAKENK